MLGKRLAALVCAALVWAAPAAAEMVSQYTDGNWRISAHADTKNGGFLFCAGSYRFPNGIDLLVFVERGGNQWALGFYKKGWNLNMEASPAIRIGIDGAALVSSNLKSPKDDFFTLTMPAGRAALDAFRLGNRMEVIVSGLVPMEFDLLGTNRLMATLDSCYARFAADPKFAARSPSSESQPSASSARPPPKESAGSGFLLNATGHVVTNEHVVRECKAISVQRPGDPEVEAKLVVADRRNDLALIKTTTALAGEVARLANSRSIQAGEKIAVYGFPLSGALSTSGNIVAGNVSALGYIPPAAYAATLIAPKRVKPAEALVATG